MFSEPKFETHDYIIGGKLVVGRAVMEESYVELLQGGDQEARNNVKRQLIMQMAEYMLENNLVEFTQMQSHNPATYEKEVAVMVRAYLAPSDQVKILRLANKIT